MCENMSYEEQKELLDLLYDKVKVLQNSQPTISDKVEFTDSLLTFVSHFDHLMQQKQSINLDAARVNQKMKNVHHITFSAGHQNLLLHIFKKIQVEIHVLDDFLSIGPLNERRNSWLYERELVHMDRALSTFTAEIRSILPEREVVIWVANNAHDRLALSYTLTQLASDIQVRIIELNPKIITAPQVEATTNNRNTNDLCAEEVVRLYNDSIDGQPMTVVERITGQELWHQAVDSAGYLRIWQDERLLFVDETYFDNQIMQLVDENYTRTVRVIGEIIAQSDEYLNDHWLFYRINELINDGVLECKTPGANLYIQEIKIKR